MDHSFWFAGDHGVRSGVRVTVAFVLERGFSWAANGCAEESTRSSLTLLSGRRRGYPGSVSCRLGGR
ncbi:hypothetical protein A5762_24705 [Mycolicibacterium elephantis]|nr:hypothetical protein A5762_24705 [Mycolicibacterium elephantis]